MATSDLAASTSGADAILLVAPSQFLRQVVEQLMPGLPATVPLVICAKGIEQGLDDLEPMMSRWLIGTKRKKRRCLYENEDIVVEHFIADFQDGTTEAVLTVHLLKDGLLWRTETGSTPIEKSKDNT